MRISAVDDARRGRALSAARTERANPVPNEFFLIIFLMVSMLVFVYFYAKRAQTRNHAPSTKSEPHAGDDVKS